MMFESAEMGRAALSSSRTLERLQQAVVIQPHHAAVFQLLLDQNTQAISFFSAPRRIQGHFAAGRAWLCCANHERTISADLCSQICNYSSEMDPVLTPDLARGRS
jgi:hypothetical protein